MPRKKEGQPIQIWMSMEDRQRLESLARSCGQTKSEFGRRAILASIEAAGRKESTERDSQVAHSLKRIEDRLAKLVVNVAIDAGTIRNVLWERTNPQVREQLFCAARTWAVKRLRESID